MTAVDYTLTENEGGVSYLSVIFVDNSYKYLDKNIVLLRGLHLGLVDKNNKETNIDGEWANNSEDWPKSFLVVGKEYKTVNIKGFEPLTFTRLTELTEEQKKKYGINHL